MEKSPCLVSLFHYLKLYLLLPGWSVRLVKNCDRGLENVASAASGSIFQAWGHGFFTSRTDSEPFLSALNWLTSGFVYATLSFNRLTLRPQNRFISNYFMFVAFSSTVKFSKIVLPMLNFVQSLKCFVISSKLIAVSRCESPEIRLFLPQIEYQIAMIKEENSTEIIFT